MTKSANDSCPVFEAEVEEEPVAPGTGGHGGGDQLLEQGCLAGAGPAHDQHVPPARRQPGEQLPGVPGRGDLHLPGLLACGQQVTLDADGRGVQRRVQSRHVGCVTAAVGEHVHDVVVGQHLAVIAQRGGQPAAVVVIVQDQEPGEAGQPGPQQRPAGCRQIPGEFGGAAAEQQLDVLGAQPAFADPQLVGGVLRQLSAAGQPVIERHVQAGEEFRFRRGGGGQAGGVLAERAAAGACVPGQHVQQPADRDQPVLISDLVPVVGGVVAQPLDLVQRVDHPVAADPGPASADQVPQCFPVRGAGRAVVDPQLLEQPFGDLPGQRDRVFRVAVRQ